MEIHWSRGPGRPPKNETVMRVTVRLIEKYYLKVIQKITAEKRATIADTVRVIIQEFFDGKEGEK